MKPTRERPFVVYWNNIPAPYMVERFNALAERGNIDFEAWFNERCELDRSWEVDESKWVFRYHYLPCLRMGKHRLRFPLPLLTRRPPDVLVSLYAEPVFLIGWLIARLRGVRTMFRTLPTFDRWVQRRWWKEQLKHYIFSRVDGVETPGKNGRKFAMRYGTPAEKVFFTTHGINIEHYAAGRIATLPERSRIRQELNLHGVTYIYVGRLWWGKGLDYLIDAFGELQKRCEIDTSLLLVGDGPEEGHLRKRSLSEGLKNVVFTGFQQKQNLPRYYAASDVFVFPTTGDPYGLVVDEAMACSLPVISTSSAGEICDRIEDGVNGFIVPAEDIVTLCNRMEQLAHDPELRVRMGQASAKKIAGHTPEQWAEDFERAVNDILSVDKK